MATVEMTQQNLDQYVEKPGIVLLDFWASWCGPCRAFAPIFEEASEKHQDVVFGKVDTEAQEELAGAFQIRAIPTLMVFRDGVIVFSHSGLLPAEALDDLLKQVRGLDMAEVHKRIAEEEAQAPKEDEWNDE